MKTNAVTQLASSVARALRSSFFGAVPPVDLGIARLLIYGHVASNIWNTRYLWETQRSLYKPVGIYHWLPVASDATLTMLLLAGQYAAVLCMLGVAFRPAAIVCACTLPYLLGLGGNFGKVDHSANLLAVALVILAFSHADEGLSIAAWWRARKGSPTVAPSGEYRWPIAAIWLTISSMYCAAGVAKLMNMGWQWALSDNFQVLLLRHHFTHSPPTQIGVWIAQYPVLCEVLATGALLAELASPLMLLGGAWLLFWGGTTFLLQLGIYLLLGVAFRHMLPLFLTFVPWYGLFVCARKLLSKRRTLG